MDRAASYIASSRRCQRRERGNLPAASCSALRHRDRATPRTCPVFAGIGRQNHKGMRALVALNGKDGQPARGPQATFLKPRRALPGWLPVAGLRHWLKQLGDTAASFPRGLCLVRHDRRRLLWLVATTLRAGRAGGFGGRGRGRARPRHPVWQQRRLGLSERGRRIVQTDAARLRGRLCRCAAQARQGERAGEAAGDGQIMDRRLIDEAATGGS